MTGTASTGAADARSSHAKSSHTEAANAQAANVQPSPERPGALTRALTLPLELLVVAYRRLISPLLPPTCRFYPSCSTYGLESLRRFGPVVGTWLTARRLLRCHPWSAGGVDHVPPRGRHGLPDWERHRALTAEREAAWARAADEDAADAVRNDDLQDPTPRAAADAIGAAAGVVADDDRGGAFDATRRGMR